MNTAHRFARIISKKNRRIIGLMSGMSMDGIDLACADLSGNFPDITVKLVSTFYMPYPSNLRKRLLDSRQACVQEISELNVLVAQSFADCIEKFLQNTKLDRHSIDAIGSHGQTLFHSTKSSNQSSSLQVGSPSIIAELIGILTIGNFRMRDIAAGGQGAPLVALADFILYREAANAVAMHNLGSISNITVVTSNLEGLLSFDSGPANIAIDYFARQVQDNISGIDSDGYLSQKGRCIPELLEQWMQLSFLNLSPPKAAGYTEFEACFREERHLKYSLEDRIRTAVEFTARTIEDAYRHFVFPKYPDLKKAVFSGGGIYNPTLMRRIKELLPELVIDTLQNEISDSKEALAFAILANETLSGRAGSFPSTTGVKRPTVLGEIAI